jgi:hypothetical protein
MAAKPARSRSAELIDFEQARTQHSKQRIRSRLDSLVELEELIARKLRSEHEPRSTSDKSASPLVTTDPEPIWVRNNSIADSIPRFGQQDTLSRFPKIGYEFSRIEERLSDIEAKLTALDAPDRVRLPTQNVGNAPYRRLNSLIHATQDYAVKEKANYIGAQSRSQWHHETALFLQHCLERSGGKIRLSLRRILTDLTPLPTDLTKGASKSDFVKSLNYNSQISKNRPGAVIDGAADRLTTTTTLLAAVTVFGFFLLVGPKPVKQVRIPAVSSHAQGSAPSASSSAEVKAAAPEIEVKVNSLQTKVALLSPELISSSLNVESSGQTSLQHEPPDLTRSAEGLPPQTVTASTALPVSDKDGIDTYVAIGDAQEQYDRATELYKLGDIKGAVSWLEKSARQGNPQAQLQLGNLYLKGAGVARNFTQARKWLETAANNGNAFAMHNLAVLYCGGEGRKPDHARASDWFRRAAERGVVDSMFNLALAYADGLGVEKDLIQAYAWFSLAAARGDAKAARKRKEIGRLLDREELYEARLLGDSFNLAQRSK